MQTHPTLAADSPASRTVVMIFNSGMASGDALLQASWSADVATLLDRNLLTIFSCANDYADLMGETKVMAKLKAHWLLSPRKCPFAAPSVFHPPGDRSCWSQANIYVYAVQGRDSGSSAACMMTRSAKTADPGAALSLATKVRQQHRPSDSSEVFSGEAAKPTQPSTLSKVECQQPDDDDVARDTTVAAVVDRPADDAEFNLLPSLHHELAAASTGAAEPCGVVGLQPVCPASALLNVGEDKPHKSAPADQISSRIVSAQCTNLGSTGLPECATLEVHGSRCVLTIALEHGVSPSSVIVQSLNGGSELLIRAPGVDTFVVRDKCWNYSKARAKGSASRRRVCITIPGRGHA